MPDKVEYLLVTRGEVRSYDSGVKPALAYPSMVLNFRMLSFPNDTCGMGLSLRSIALYFYISEERL